MIVTKHSHSLSPTTTNHARHCCQQCSSPPPPFMTAHECQWPQCHHDRPKNKDGRPQMTTNAHPTNDSLDPQTDMGSDKPRWVNPPLLTLHFVHMEYRCHIVVSDVAAKWQTMTLAMLSIVIVLDLRHHGEYPPSHICPNSPCWDTGQWQPSTMMQHRHKTTTRTQDEDVAKTGGNEDMRWGHTRIGQWQHVVMTTHSNNNTWWQWYTATTLSLSHHPYPPTFNIPIPLTSPSPLPLTSPSL